MINQILLSLKHGTITLAQAEAEIQGLIELERVQLRDTFAGQALITSAAYSHADVVTWGADDFAQHAYLVADAMLEARKS